MAGSSSAKPYAKAVANYPQRKEEIDQLPLKYWVILSEFPYINGSYIVDKDEFFQNLVLYCIEADHAKSSGNFYERALKIVETELQKQRTEMNKLYNPHRNICIDKCYGESKTPLGEWMIFSEQEE